MKGGLLLASAAILFATSALASDDDGAESDKGAYFEEKRANAYHDPENPDEEAAPASGNAAARNAAAASAASLPYLPMTPYFVGVEQLASILGVGLGSGQLTAGSLAPRPPRRPPAPPAEPLGEDDKFPDVAGISVPDRQSTVPLLPPRPQSPVPKAPVVPDFVPIMAPSLVPPLTGAVPERIVNRPRPFAPPPRPARQQQEKQHGGGRSYWLDLCFYLGDDVLHSHVPYNPQWNTGTVEGYKRYINELTFNTTLVLNRVDEFKQVSNHDFFLRWTGPWQRSDYRDRYPNKAMEDTISASKYGCDMVVFMVFNNYTGVEATDGHEFSGLAKGGACEAKAGSGFAVVVDQGFLGEVWVGPQVLAHHILLLLTSDLREARNCPGRNSLLYEKIEAGTQWRDGCVESKLRRSRIPLRSCL